MYFITITNPHITLNKIGGYMRNTIIYGPTYNVGGLELPLYNGEHSEQGFIKEILDMGLKVFSDYQIAHNKVLFFTVTLKYPVMFDIESLNNDIIVQFCHEMCRKLKDEGYDPAYFWVRERDTSLHNHFHLALWLNGAVTQHPKRSIEIIKSAWDKYVRITGCVHFANVYEHAVRLDRPSDATKDNGENQLKFLKAYKTFSYLAKAYSKETDLQPNCRHYGHSQPKRVDQYEIFENWKVPQKYMDKLEEDTVMYNW